MQTLLNFLTNAKSLVLRRKKLFLILGLILVALIFIWNVMQPKMSSQQYQTAQVTKGTLVVSLSESGTVAVANRQPITTSASGVVSEVDVKNGDSVAVGQTIAKISLDSVSLQKQAAAWSSYLSAQNALTMAQADMNTLQSTLFKTNQAFVTDRGVPNPTDQQKADPVYIEENDAWLAAQAAYVNQQNVIAQDQAGVTSAWLSYQQLSGTITVSVAGTISDLTVAPGMQIAAVTSTTTVSSQTIASVKTQGNPIISVTLSEIDAAKVQQGQKATVTFDALPNQTFSGVVLGINTSGTISSGVTTYPATIQLDTPDDAILPNMSTTANIITDVKPDVLLVPSAAVQTTSGQSFVRVLQNNTVTMVPVATGESSDSDTEITSGLAQGQTVIIGSVANSPANSTTSSPFGALRGFGGGGGGGGGVFFRGGGGGGGGGARGG